MSIEKFTCVIAQERGGYGKKKDGKIIGGESQRVYGAGIQLSRIDLFEFQRALKL